MQVSTVPCSECPPSRQACSCLPSARGWTMSWLELAACRGTPPPSGKRALCSCFSTLWLRRSVIILFWSLCLTVSLPVVTGVNHGLIVQEHYQNQPNGHYTENIVPQGSDSVVNEPKGYTAPYGHRGRIYEKDHKFETGQFVHIGEGHNLGRIDQGEQDFVIATPEREELKKENYMEYDMQSVPVHAFEENLQKAHSYHDVVRIFYKMDLSDEDIDNILMTQQSDEENHKQRPTSAADAVIGRAVHPSLPGIYHMFRYNKPPCQNCHYIPVSRPEIMAPKHRHRRHHRRKTKPVSSSSTVKETQLAVRGDSDSVNKRLPVPQWIQMPQSDMAARMHNDRNMNHPLSVPRANISPVRNSHSFSSIRESRKDKHKDKKKRGKKERRGKKRGQKKRDNKKKKGQGKKRERKRKRRKKSKVGEDMKAAFEHSHQMAKAAKCEHPVPVTVPIRSVTRLANHLYYPECTIVHRCRNEFGCCPPNHQCTVKTNTTITRSFWKVRLSIDGKSVGAGSQMVENFTFENHTRCECAPIKTIPMCKKCPLPFKLIRENITDCTCDCRDGDKNCRRIKRGRTNLHENQLECIKNQTCDRPKCEYGLFDDHSLRAGYCPQKPRADEGITNLSGASGTSFSFSKVRGPKGRGKG